MTSVMFAAWLAVMRDKKLAATDAEAAKLLGVAASTMTRLKEKGGDQRLALACSALVAELEPFDLVREGVRRMGLSARP